MYRWNRRCWRGPALALLGCYHFLTASGIGSFLPACSSPFPVFLGGGLGCLFSLFKLAHMGASCNNWDLILGSGRHVVTTPRRDSRWICGRARVASRIASWRVNTVPCPADVLVSRQVFSNLGSASSDGVQIDVTASFECFEQVTRTSQGMTIYFQGWQSIIR